MGHMTFSDYEYSNRKRITKREEFLDIMDEIIPWDESSRRYTTSKAVTAAIRPEWTENECERTTCNDRFTS